MLEHDLERLADAAGRAGSPPPPATIRRRARRRSTVRLSAAGGLVAAAIAVAFVALPGGGPAPQPPISSSAPATTAPAGTGPAPSAAATSAPATQQEPTSRPPSSPTSATAAAVPCRAASGLKVTAGPQNAGSGHRSVTLVFTNRGARPCRMTGYPGVAALDAGGGQVAQAKRTLHGYLGGAQSVQTVTIPAGGTAEAVVEAMAFNPADGSACAAYAGLLVTPPDDTASTQLPWGNDGCAELEIHPVT
ncbi:DUF4232 domain-containing protein [Dactylosporangium sp. CA-139066]|uniref:DUF4232 domain-containing protein n=1 Tax=Dactylosporangium sp. CA-139066 TaxID=3239930 RepID=UPI003D917E19